MLLDFWSMRDIQRTDQGYRCGQHHHNSRYTDVVVNQVRDLQDSGLGWRRIARQLGLKPDWVKQVCAFRLRVLVKPSMGVSA